MAHDLRIFKMDTQSRQNLLHGRKRSKINFIRSDEANTKHHRETLAAVGTFNTNG